MVSPFRTKEFKILQKEWDKKLKDSGFNDIEKEGSTQRLLKQSSHPYDEMTSIIAEAKQRYYELMTHAFNAYGCDNPVHTAIMKMAIEGAKKTEIARELKAQGMPRHRMQVMFIIRRYELRWGVRHWRKDQLEAVKSKKGTDGH